MHVFSPRLDSESYPKQTDFVMDYEFVFERQDYYLEIQKSVFTRCEADNIRFLWISFPQPLAFDYMKPKKKWFL